MNYIVEDTRKDVSIHTAIDHLNRDLIETKRELKADIAAVSERVTAVETRVVNVEDDNSTLKRFTSSLEEQIKEVRQQHYRSIIHKLIQLTVIFLIVALIIYIVTR